MNPADTRTVPATADTAPAPAPLDVARIRAGFPILGQKVHGNRLVFLDNAASSQKPRQVIDALTEYYETSHANVHRGAHELSIRATHAYEDARGKVARFVGAGRTDEIIFTRGTTESINLVASAWGRANVSAGDEIVVTEMEHHSNLIPWHLLAEATGAAIRVVPATDEGVLDLDVLDTILAGGTAKIVAVGHVSNAFGTIHPLEEIVARAHAAGALVLADAAQAVPQVPVDVRALGCDFYAFSGHKMCGPTGIGVLWGRKEILNAMPPYQGGGEMIDEVWVDRSTYASVPRRFEAGTPSIADAIGLGAAVDYLTEVGIDRVHAHEKRLVRHMQERLAAEFDQITLYGPPADVARGGVVSFTLADIHPHDLATILDYEGVAIRAGHHCCQPLMRRYGIAATARASVYLYNDEDDVEVLVAALHRAQELFGIG